MSVHFVESNISPSFSCNYAEKEVKKELSFQEEVKRECKIRKLFIEDFKFLGEKTSLFSNKAFVVDSIQKGIFEIENP